MLGGGEEPPPPSHPGAGSWHPPRATKHARAWKLLGRLFGLGFFFPPLLAPSSEMSDEPKRRVRWAQRRAAALGLSQAPGGASLSHPSSLRPPSALFSARSPQPAPKGQPSTSTSIQEVETSRRSAERGYIQLRSEKLWLNLSWLRGNRRYGAAWDGARRASVCDSGGSTPPLPLHVMLPRGIIFFFSYLSPPAGIIQLRSTMTEKCRDPPARSKR